MVYARCRVCSLHELQYSRYTTAHNARSVPARAIREHRMVSQLVRLPNDTISPCDNLSRTAQALQNYCNRDPITACRPRARPTDGGTRTAPASPSASRRGVAQK